MALFCLKAALQQVRQGRCFALVHLEKKSTLWNLRMAKTLENSPGVSWGRVSVLLLGSDEQLLHQGNLSLFLAVTTL